MPGATTAYPYNVDGFIHGVPDPALADAVNYMQGVEGCFPPETLNNVIAQSIPDTLATSTVTLTAGTVFQTPIALRAGQVVNNLSFITAGSGASTPTHSWVGLAYPFNPSTANSFTEATSKVVAISADGLTAAIAANTIITTALSAAYTVPTTGYYIAFVCIAGTTGPTAAAGVTLGTAGRGAIEGFFTGPGDTGQTTPYAVGATIGETSAFAAQLLLYAN